MLAGRAAWLDEKSLKIIAPFEKTKEEIFMIDESVYPTNGEPKAAPELTEADGLLMYQARQNVRDRKNLLRHVVAFLVALPLLGVFYGAVIDNMTHPRAWKASRVVNELNAMHPYLDWERETTVGDAIFLINSSFRHNYTPVIWWVIVGAMLAWGGWIAVRVAKRAVKKLRSSARKDKPDPVIAEYSRLKNLAENE